MSVLVLLLPKCAVVWYKMHKEARGKATSPCTFLQHFKLNERHWHDLHIRVSTLYCQLTDAERQAESFARG